MSIVSNITSKGSQAGGGSPTTSIHSIKPSKTSRLQTAPPPGTPGAVPILGSADIVKLDHKNFPKAFSSPKRTVAAPPKPPKVPGVRTYPGDMTLARRGPPRGAVYAEDLDREERELHEQYLSPQYHLSHEDLLRHQDFLKIDQSKLPLEMFDNVEFAEKDLSPKQWIKSGSAGKSPYFHNGTWIWHAVEVLGYDEETSEYTVKFVPDGMEKKVRRLNLHFDQEDPVIFKERKRIAEEARDEAKRIMRLDHFINQQPKNLVQPIRQVNIRRMHDRIIGGLPSSVPAPTPDSPLGHLLRNLTGELILFYARTMRRTVLFAKMEGVYKDEKTIAHYDELKLPPPPVKPPVPTNGKVPCPEFPFPDRAFRIESYHYSSQTEVLGVFKWLHDRWIQKFQYYSFVDFCTDVELPCSIKDFKSLQFEKSSSTMKLLEKVHCNTASPHPTQPLITLHSLSVIEPKQPTLSNTYPLIHVPSQMHITIGISSSIFGSNDGQCTRRLRLLPIELQCLPIRTSVQALPGH